MNRRKRAKYVLTGLVLWLLVHTLVVVAEGLQSPSAAADVAVVLGNKVNEDGTLSERLVQRLRCGLGLYRSGQVKQLIVSGGLGKEGFYEGEKMKQYLVEQGVPAADILVDNQGNSTRQTVVNVLSLRDSLHFSSLIVVSQYYHLTRTKMLFRQAGFRFVSSASPWYFEWRDLYSLAREFVAYYQHLSG
ncbi:YdcF family protein [Hymenobacter rubripertinctus]|nr:YdcF family protein [Hymenobacter rubripertinctus]